MAIIISEREREEKRESIVSLAKPSHATTMCLKIKVACTLWPIVGTVSCLTGVLSSGQALTFFKMEDVQIAPCAQAMLVCTQIEVDNTMSF